MKIVGRTDDGYLAQISDGEIGICLGFGPYPSYGDTKEAWYKATSQDSRNPGIKTGTKIDVYAAHNYLRTLAEKQEQAKVCASVLRQLADMITTGLPAVVIPPQPSPEAE
jgi:hypothetical protein